MSIERTRRLIMRGRECYHSDVQNANAIYLQALFEEDTNLIVAEQELAKCVEDVEYHRDQVWRLRAAILVLSPLWGSAPRRKEQADG